MFDWLSSPEAWIALASLTALEIVLGVDNIIFISILVGRLPPEERQRARVIGLDPSRMPYLSTAGTFLGNVAADRIDQRGEDPARYRTVFQIREAFKGLKLATGG